VSWDLGRWWYRLAHVCQRWRNLILGSASYLGLSLVCTNGAPVENMLAHSPPLPLTVDYMQKMKRGYCLLSSGVIPNPGIPDCVPFDEDQHGIDAPGNTSSTKSTSPHARRLRLSNTISITPDCRKPCHTLSCNKSPIRLLSTKYTASMDFIYAPVRESRDRLFIPCSQPWCGEATHTYANYDTHYTS
jgi:hypothetical protein